MTFKKETPTKPGYYLWRTKLTSGPVIAEILTVGESPVLWIETDGGRETLNEFVEVQRDNNLEWCRLVPAEEIEKAWYEGYDYTLYVPDQSTGADLRRWLTSRAKRVMGGDV